MPCIWYKDPSNARGEFNDVQQLVIDRANQIIADYQAQGFTLTLRQLYYQFIARDWFPDCKPWLNPARNVKNGLDPNTKNTTHNYDNLGVLISDARLAGLVDWNAIEDRGRNLKGLSHWDSVADIIGACEYSFRLDKWHGQEYRPEVWVEKEALVGVIQGVCNELDISYFACKGYNSMSEMWRAGERYRRIIAEGQTPYLIHLGDHDPSGLDMSEDIRKRLGMFVERDEFATWPVQRVALNMDQVLQYNPPPNPAKVTDSRFKAYAAQYGTDSWELDAMEPAMLVTTIRQAVEAIRDDAKWEARRQEERDGRDRLRRIAYLERNGGIPLDDDEELT